MDDDRIREENKRLYEAVYEDVSLAWVSGNLQILHEILNCIRHGDTEHIRSLINVIPPDFEARFGETPLRHMKNLVISLVQIMAITAMDAGVSASLCIRLAERITRQSEKSGSSKELMEIADNAKIEFCAMSAQLLKPSADDQRIQKAVSFINEHVTEKITRKKLAGISGMSEEYFSRRFHALTGMTASQYVQSAKIQQAKRMLAETDVPLSSISSYLSFSSQNYFQKVFREHENCTPLQYRRKNSHN